MRLGSEERAKIESLKEIMRFLPKLEGWNNCRQWMERIYRWFVQLEIYETLDLEQSAASGSFKIAVSLIFDELIKDFLDEYKNI